MQNYLHIKGRDMIEKFIDIHTHILPNVDDGSKSMEESISLIKEEIEQGVDTIVLTPHFSPDTDDYEKFLKRTRRGYELLKLEAEVSGIDIKLFLGAEVRISLKLLEIDLEPLCIEGTNYILIEFSMTQRYSWTDYVISGIQSRGYVPIIAHTERYPDVSLEEVEELIKLGALIQVNIGSLFETRKSKKIVEKLIRKDYIHLLGTDTHSMDKRPVTMEQGIEYLEKKYSEELLIKYLNNAKKVLSDKYL